MREYSILHRLLEWCKIERMKKKYHSVAYSKISDEKRDRIISVALEEFANKGFGGANTNIIAKKAGISVGSLFKYFETKENLFITIVDHGVSQLEVALHNIKDLEGDFFQKIEALLRIVLSHTRENQNIIRLYNEMTSDGNAELMRKASRRLESVASKEYIMLLNEAKAQGVISSHIDSNVVAFVLDSIMVVLQFSYASDYYKERLKIYFGEDISHNDDYLIRELMDFITRTLK